MVNGDRVVIDYFSKIFSSTHSPVDGEILDAIDRQVTEDMNASLRREFDVEDIKMVVLQMQHLTSPGRDGLPSLFFQKFWNIVGEYVSATILSFLNLGNLLKKLNFTYITLIPKVKTPEDMSQLRPISLCNVLYKIASKVIANRLKPILQHIISRQQSAFIPGCQISDNTMVAMELSHFIFKRCRGKKGFLSLKLDMNKAYDRIEWEYLRNVLLRLGFCREWTKLIMTCVSTVSYVFLVNGVPKG